MAEFVYQNGKLEEKVSYHYVSIEEVERVLNSLENKKEFQDQEILNKKFNIGDKVKIISDRIYKNRPFESINLKNSLGEVSNYLIAETGAKEQNKTVIGYKVDINGIEIIFQDDELELIEKSKVIDYRKDLYNLADDIDGFLLPDSKKSTSLIQGFNNEK